MRGADEIRPEAKSERCDGARVVLAVLHSWEWRESTIRHSCEHSGVHCPVVVRADSVNGRVKVPTGGREKSPPRRRRQALGDGLIERDTPVVWEVNGSQLHTGLSLRDKTLVLLHATPGAGSEATVRGWVEAKNAMQHRQTIMERLHREKLVEYDGTARTVTLSRRGRDYVEGRLAAWVLR